MTPQDALIDLLARVGAGQGASVFISAQELGEWPTAAVTAMKAHRLLLKTRSAASVVCPGCERECVMPVHTLPDTKCEPTSFIVCDKRSDINRVAVSSARLTQWRSDAQAIARFVAARLVLRRSCELGEVSDSLSIGIAAGDKRRQMLCLRANGDLTLVVGDHAVPIADLIGYSDGEYTVDATVIRQLVDSATTADPRYTPSNARREVRKLDTQAMYESWQKAYRDLKQRRRNMSDVWYAQQIAKLDIAIGRSADTIRKHVKK